MYIVSRLVLAVISTTTV